MRPSPFTRIAVLAAALLLANCAQNPVTGNPSLVLLSEGDSPKQGIVRNGLYPAGEPVAGQTLNIIE